MSVVIIREEVYVCVSEKQDFNLGAGDAFRSKDREIPNNVGEVVPASKVCTPIPRH